MDAKEQWLKFQLEFTSSLVTMGGDMGDTGPSGPCTETASAAATRLTS
jgi:hypothetical protein